MPADPPPVMACMEVWGGNSATDRSFSMLGLETWIYSRPYQQADGGGDVYYISRCATGRITRLLVADVSGHGAHVAQIGERLRRLMRRHVNHIEQRQFLAEMNREFGEVRHAGGFATAVAASFFSPESRIAITNAGHPPPLIYRRKSQQWAILENDASAQGELVDFPLGLLEDTQYGEIRFDAEPGDLLVFYTDSLIESRNAQGDLLGPKGLLQIISQLDPNQPQELIESLLAQIAALHPGNLQDDDVTVLVCRPSGVETEVPLINRIKAPWLFLKGCVQAILTGNRLPLPEFSRENIGGSLFKVRKPKPR